MPTKDLAQTDDTGRGGVTDEHRQEAAALKALYEQYRAAQMKQGVRVTQLGFATEHGIGTTQGILWQYLNARIPLNLKVAIKFAEALKCQVRDFSPRLAAEQDRLAPVRAPGPKTALQSVLELNPLEQQLLGLYRDLKPEMRDELLAKANDLYSRAHPHSSPANPFGTPKRRVKEKETR